MDQVKAEDRNTPWTELGSSTSLAFHATVAVKTTRALLWCTTKASGRSPADGRSGARPLRQAARPKCSYCTNLAWDAAQIKSCRPTLFGGRSSAPLRTASNSSGWENKPTAFPKGVERTTPVGFSALQHGDRVVPSGGTSLPANAVSALVHEEGRTLVCRPTDDLEAGQLRRKNPTTAAEAVLLENLDRPDRRASQPSGIGAARLGNVQVYTRCITASPGRESPRGPIEIRLAVRRVLNRCI